MTYDDVKILTDQEVKGIYNDVYNSLAEVLPSGTGSPVRGMGADRGTRERAAEKVQELSTGCTPDPELDGPAGS